MRKRQILPKVCNSWKFEFCLSNLGKTDVQVNGGVQRQNNFYKMRFNCIIRFCYARNFYWYINKLLGWLSCFQHLCFISLIFTFIWFRYERIITINYQELITTFVTTITIPNLWIFFIKFLCCWTWNNQKIISDIKIVKN